MKTLFKLLAVSMCMAIFVNTPIVSFAATADGENVAVPYLTYITSYDVSLNFSNGNALVSGSVTGKSGVTKSIVICNLEKLVGSYWLQVQSFTDTKAGSSASVSGSYPVDAGTYRVYGSFTCNNEIRTAYTANKSYP